MSNQHPPSGDITYIAHLAEEGDGFAIVFLFTDGDCRAVGPVVTVEITEAQYDELERGGPLQAGDILVPGWRRTSLSTM